MSQRQSSPSDEGFWAVIPAGGAGTRLWPLSRAANPKFLHDLTGSGRTLLQATRERLTAVAGDRVIVVTGAGHAAAVRAQLPDLPAANVLAEPAPRDSMAAIGLAAAVLERRDPAAVLGSFAADHVIGQPERLHAALREAIGTARRGFAVTLGIEPASPATGFGYIHVGDVVGDVPAGSAEPGTGGARRVLAFTEKPDAATAAAYVASGEYRWNAGMYIVQARVLLDLLGTYHPEFARELRAIAADPAVLPQRWAHLPRISIDHAVAEPAAADGHLAVVPLDVDWDDVGDFDSLSALLGAGASGRPLAVLGDPDQVLSLDATGLVAAGSGRLVAVLGLQDVVVVDTPDALLVTTRERAQEVKSLVDALKARTRADLT